VRGKLTLAARVACVLLVAACGDGGTGTGPSGLLDGSFALVRVEGAPLPITLGRIVSVSLPDGVQLTCTQYLTAMRIDVTSFGSATRNESRLVTCDDGRADATSSLTVAGTVSAIGDGWRFDFAAMNSFFAARYFGRMDGSNLTIVRRETDVTIETPGQTGTPAPIVNVDLSQLLFSRI
jgi:hypothetical protein